MVDITQRLAQPVNNVAQAYQAKTQQIEGERQKEQQARARATKARDNQMLKVFEFAGDGMVNEAKHYAQTNGLEIPDAVFSDADFAKGLQTAGDFYGNDPAGAQKFTMAWAKTKGLGSYADRVLQSSKIAGLPINTADRNFQEKMKLEQFKNDLKLKNQRRDLFIDATTESLGSFNPNSSAGAQAVQSYDEYFQPDAPSKGLTGFSGGHSPPPQTRTPPPAPQQPQIPSGLPQGSVMIGTTNGRPVYQAPNGERFVDDGNP